MSTTQYAVVVSALLGLAGQSGCTASHGRHQADKPLCLRGATRQDTFEAAVTVLGRMRFSIDKADPNTGIIRTRPLPAGQFFEFWRGDNVTLRDQIEANLQSLRRTVWITVQPRSKDVCVDCLVRVQRLNMPSRAVSGSATAYRTLSESTAEAQSLRLSPEQQKAMEWVDLGTDTALAGRILGRILGELRAAKR